MASLRYYLFFDHIMIENANAISSPLTYGFPAISGFLGAIHALSRKITYPDPIYLDGVLIACHDCNVQAFKRTPYADYTFNLTRNPLLKNGNTRSIIEEGRVHLDVSLFVEVKVEKRNSLNDPAEQQQFIEQMRQKLFQQRIAGGNVVAIEDVALFSVEGETNDWINKLFPAYVLVDATDELNDITKTRQQKDEQATTLDILVETAMLLHTPQDDRTFKTTTIKSEHGWLVPLHLGYKAISPLFEAGKMAQSRSNDYPTQFVECIYGLGKWVFPHRLGEHFSSSFWRYQPSELQSNNLDIYIINQTLSN